MGQIAIVVVMLLPPLSVGRLVAFELRSAGPCRHFGDPDCRPAGLIEL